ncbi:MAG: hypothetical protein HUU38_09895 [Anaerolineales bacterium]|nr:hypothetical protein [Anaerolineales bacterium]
MKTPYLLGTFLGLKFTLQPSSLIATFGLWGSLTVVGLRGFSLPWWEAVFGGLLATMLYWVSEIWHQYGHALAARWVGYPMIGVELWWAFGRSIYPTDEPELPARVHIRRALGGAPASLVLTLLAGGIMLGMPPDGRWYWLGGYFFLINLLVFTVGAFLPLGFTDGSTLLRYWKQKSTEGKI